MARVIQRTTLPPTSLHHLRYVKNKILGVSTELIAKEEGVDEKYVLRSISQVEAYNAMNTMDDLRISQVEVVLFNAKLEKAALHSALQAETKILNDKGKVIAREPNHEIRLKGVEMMTEISKNLIMAEARSNSPSGTNVQVNVGGMGTTVGIATFEDRLREVKKKRSELEQKNPPALPPQEPIDVEVEEIRPNWEGPLEQGI